MRLLGYNKFWNRWDEIYDFPFLRENYETIRVLTYLDPIKINEFENINMGKVFLDIQKEHYSEFKYIEYNPDSLNAIRGDISFVLSNLIWLWIKFIMSKIYHPLLRLHDKLARFSKINNL